jgi:hypothetical protein
MLLRLCGYRHARRFLTHTATIASSDYAQP